MNSQQAPINNNTNTNNISNNNDNAEFETMFSKVTTAPVSENNIYGDGFALDDGITAFNNNDNDNNNNHRDFPDDIGVPESQHSSPSSPFSRSVSPSDHEGFAAPYYSGHSSLVPQVPDLLQQQQQQQPSSFQRGQTHFSVHQPSILSLPMHQTYPLFTHFPTTMSTKPSQKRPSPSAVAQEEEEKKRLVKRQKNNEAASKCRMKKRIADEENAGRSKILEEENAILRKELERLQAETKCLKDVIVTLSASKTNNW